MALTQCPECNGKVSRTAKTCPHCGHGLTFGRRGLEHAKDTVGGLWSALLLFIAFGFLFSCVAHIVG